jgi:hypothetical protein
MKKQFYLSRQVLEDGGHVDGRARPHSLSIVSLPQQPTTLHLMKNPGRSWQPMLQIILGSRIRISIYIKSRQGCGFGSLSGSTWICVNLSCWIRILIQNADPDPVPGEQK